MAAAASDAEPLSNVTTTRQTRLNWWILAIAILATSLAILSLFATS